MSIATWPLPKSADEILAQCGDSLFRISVGMYHEMIESGVLGADEDVELLEGLLVKKMAKNNPHTYSSEAMRDELDAIVPEGWHINSQNPVTTDDSEPEPDLAVVRGKRRDYLVEKPRAAQTGMLVEVAGTSLQRDRAKRLIYAKAGFAVYWIVNLVDNVIEVYSQPSGPIENPDYLAVRTYSAAESVPVVLDGQEIGAIQVSDVLP